jgi:hypothetical protein
MIKYNQLHIPNPCYIDYESLPYDAVKRPCDVCVKPVYDFRGKDEAYFTKIWNKHNGDLCGAFTHDQFQKNHINTYPFFSFKNIKSKVMTLLFGLWSITSKAQNDSTQVINKVEYNPIDSLKESGPRKMLMTEDCKTCRDEVYINILINKIPYKELHVKDSTIIYFPSTIKATDIITIEKRIVKRPQGWINRVYKLRKVEFQFGDRDVVEIKATKTKRLRLVYRRLRVGCPKFR